MYLLPFVDVGSSPTIPFKRPCFLDGSQWGWGFWLWRITFLALYTLLYPALYILSYPGQYNLLLTQSNAFFAPNDPNDHEPLEVL